MRWRFWLIDLPATAVDVWFVAYRVLLTVMTIACVSTVLIGLALWFGFGIRWGW